MTHDDLTTLAKTIWGEARGEHSDGQMAVALVVVNRLAANRKHWGYTIRDVCLKPKQFSCWNSADPNRAKLDALKLPSVPYLRAIGIAAMVLSGEVPDITNGATHYLALGSLPTGPPRWAKGMPVTAVVGRHTFYYEAA